MSWTWHDVAILDAIWKPKCLKRGWPIPYTPTRFEVGAWRAWYVQCVEKVEAMAAQAQSSTENSIEAAIAAVKAARKAEEKALREAQGGIGAHTRPAFARAAQSDAGEESSSDEDEDDVIAPEHRILRRHVQDCELKLLALLQKTGLDQYGAAVMGRAGISSRRSDSTAGADGQVAARERTRRRQMETSRAIEAIEAVMKARVATARSEEVRRRVAREMRDPSQTASSSSSYRPLDPLPGAMRGTTILSERERVDMSREDNPEGNATDKDDVLPNTLTDDRHPRIVLVSSDCHARVLLLNAVRFDVVAIPYEAEGTTAESLLRRLANLLRHRKVQPLATYPNVLACHAHTRTHALTTSLLYLLGYNTCETP